jgi:phosphatidylserine/phosphatidylglycerophosphate/cardiolipin synthase-like enzyme
MKLIVQPEDGQTPIVRAVRNARHQVDIVIFRLDVQELEDALGAAVKRGVTVRALVANRNRNGEKGLRKLEQRLLEAGVTVARSNDDLARYHGKVLIVDGTLYVLGFNYTRLDIESSRSFGIVTNDARLVKAGSELFDRDVARQPFDPPDERLVVSPENARGVLAEFIKGARRSLYIYDMNVSDKQMLKLLSERLHAGVDVRAIGKVERIADGMGLRKLSQLRLHARAIVRDGARAFVGSQSLRWAELDQRREIGVIVTDSRIARRLQSVFESDWEQAKPKQEPEPVGAATRHASSPSVA